MRSKTLNLHLIFLLLFFGIFSTVTTSATSKNYSYTSDDVKIFNQILKEFEYKKDIPTPTLFTEIAKYLLGTPYKAGTLEVIPEELVVNLRETDCILFIETCTALTLTIKGISPSDTTQQESSFKLYCENLKDIRYRNGIISGYESRLHYASEWILENQKKGIFKEITNLYGKPLDQKFSFMSSNPDYYTQLRNSSDVTRRIRLIEAKLNKLGSFYSIPKDNIEDMSNQIKDGDIIYFVTKVKGLDVSHVGIALWVEDQLHLIHASSKEEEVVIEDETLEEYTKIGIRVVRFL